MNKLRLYNYMFDELKPMGQEENLENLQVGYFFEPNTGKNMKTEPILYDKNLIMIAFKQNQIKKFGDLVMDKPTAKRLWLELGRML